MGKALVATTALAGGTLPSLTAPLASRMMPAKSNRDTSEQTAMVSEGSSGTSLGSSENEAASQSTTSIPAAPSLPVSAVPSLPVLTSIVSAVAAPPVPVAVTAAPLVADDVPVGATPVRPGSEKVSPVKTAGFPASGVQQAQGGAPQTVTLPIPVDLTVPQINVRPRVSDANEASSSQPVESATLPATSGVAQPEAAVSIVIQTGQSNSPAPQVLQSNAPQQIPAPVTAPIVPAAVVIPSAGVEPDRKKIELPPGNSSGNSSGNEPQAATVADVPVKVEPAKVEQHTEIKAEAPVHEPAAPEKAQPAQLRSLSLEFTPDGARDVRVRIAERAGEVHVSLHSSDPGVARDLRNGAADLSSTLTQAGYDAQTWTSGRQQQNPQQQRDEQPSRQSNANAGREDFDGLMTGTRETL